MQELSLCRYWCSLLCTCDSDQFRQTESELRIHDQQNKEYSTHKATACKPLLSFGLAMRPTQSDEYQQDKSAAPTQLIELDKLCMTWQGQLLPNRSWGDCA